MITNINDFKKINENNDFSNIGKDENGNVIGNCNICNMKGVLILNHIHKTNEEINSEDKEERNNLEDMLYVGDFEV